MAALYTLRDNIFRSREEAFHWDLQDSVELLCAVLVVSGAGVEEDERNCDDPAILNAYFENVRNNYSYEKNSFVAVRTERDTTYFPSWFGKVL